MALRETPDAAGWPAGSVGEDLTQGNTISRRCPICGGVVGVYEPLVRVRAGVRTETSLAADAASPGDVYLHRACAARLPESAADGPDSAEGE